MALAAQIRRSLFAGACWARVTVWLVGVTMALYAAVTLAAPVLAYAYAYAFLDGAWAGRRAALEAIVAGCETAQIVVQVIAALAFFAWLRRALLTAIVLCDDTDSLFDASPLFVIAGFLFPIVNLVLPIVVMRRLADLTDPRHLPSPIESTEDASATYRSSARVEVRRSWRAPRVPAIAWWALYVPIVYVNSDFLVERPLVGHAAAAWAWTALSAAVCVVSGALCIGVVRGIDARLAERARRLAAIDSSP